jgi:hypothetical protein
MRAIGVTSRGGNGRGQRSFKNAVEQGAIEQGVIEQVDKEDEEKSIDRVRRRLLRARTVASWIKPVTVPTDSEEEEEEEEPVGRSTRKRLCAGKIVNVSMCRESGLSLHPPTGNRLSLTATTNRPGMWVNALLVVRKGASVLDLLSS